LKNILLSRTQKQQCANESSLEIPSLTHHEKVLFVGQNKEKQKKRKKVTS